MIEKCFQCGVCCGLFLINLNKEEYQSGKYKTQFKEFGLIDDFYKATSCGANLLKQKTNGDCIYLKANKCSIHKIRPLVCRDFFCTSKSQRLRKMVDQIEKKHMYYFYMLRCSDNSLYSGQTNNLEKRIKEHNAVNSKTKYTRSRQPVKLVYFEKYSTLKEAMKREYEIKQWPKAEKETLVK